MAKKQKSFEAWKGPGPSTAGPYPTWQVQFKIEPVVEAANRITGIGEITDLTPDGIILAEIKASDLWDLYSLVEGEVLDELRALGWTAEVSKPELKEE